MSDRLRTVLLAVVLLALAYVFARQYAPATLTTTNEAIVFLFVLAAVAIKLRRGEAGSATEEPDFDRLFQGSGSDYEEGCREVLKSLGWHINLTRKTRDRGADVYAEKDRTRLLIQCKNYGRPVSFKAVSELNTAKSFYKADHHCVIAPNGFTRDAEEAARQLGIKLLHHNQLRQYARSLAK